MCLRALAGFFIGAIIGSVACTAVFGTTNPNSRRDSGMPDAFFGVIFGVPVGGLIGALILMAVGAIMKNRDRH